MVTKNFREAFLLVSLSCTRLAFAATAALFAYVTVGSTSAIAASPVAQPGSLPSAPAAVGAISRPANEPVTVPVDESKLPPEQAVVIGPNLFWQSTGWATFLDTGVVAMDDTSGWPRVVMGVPWSMHIWRYGLVIPVDLQRYPIGVMTYRARNIWPDEGYVIYYAETSGHFLELFRNEELIDDGQVHELRKDVREYESKGQIDALALSIRSGMKVPAEFELLGLRFEHAADALAVEMPKDDKPIALRVVDPKVQPVEGATVTVDAERPNWARSALTDKDGRATVTPLANDAGKHMLRVSKPGFVAVETGGRSDTQLPEQVTLSPGLCYGGITKDEDGRPVPGTGIGIQLAGSQEAARTRSTLNLITDARGRWETPLLPADLNSSSLSLRVAHPDYVSDPLYGPATPTPPIENLRDGTATIVLKRGVDLSGVVLKPDGSPAIDAMVRQDRQREGAEYTQTRTDDKGRFSFKHLRAGEVILTVQAHNCAPELKVLNVVPGMGPVDFHLSPGRLLRGRVVGQDGRPIEGASVSADAWRGCSTLNWRTKTDSQGCFEWEEAPADVVLCHAGKQGYMHARNLSLTVSDQEAVITLPPPLRIKGKVVDPESGKPVAKFRAICGMDWGQEGQRYWLRRGDREQIFNDGAYEMAFTEPCPSYLVRIEAEGYRPSISRRISDDEGEVTMDFALEKGVPLTGIVVGPDGKPLTGVNVALATPGAALYMENGRIHEYSGSPEVTTDADGKFTFPPEVENYKLVAVHDQGYGEVGGSDFGPGGQITLHPWGRIEGKLMVGSKLAPGEHVKAWRYQPRYDPNQPRLHFDLSDQTDKDGRFVLDRVPPGELQVARRVPVGQWGWIPSQAETLVVEPGKTVEVTLGGKGRPVIGQVIAPAGGDIPIPPGTEVKIRTKLDLPKPPLPDNWDQMDSKAQHQWNENWYKTTEGKTYLQAHEEAQRTTEYYGDIVNSDGTFRVEDIPAGNYVLEVELFRSPQNRQAGVIGTVSHEFIIPEMPGGRSDEPLDLGKLEMKPLNSRSATDQ